MYVLKAKGACHRMQTSFLGLMKELLRPWYHNLTLNYDLECVKDGLLLTAPPSCDQEKSLIEVQILPLFERLWIFWRKFVDWLSKLKLQVCGGLLTLESQWKKFMFTASTADSQFRLFGIPKHTWSRLHESDAACNCILSLLFRLTCSFGPPWQWRITMTLFMGKRVIWKRWFMSKRIKHFCWIYQISVFCIFFCVCTCKFFPYSHHSTCINTENFFKV